MAVFTGKTYKGDTINLDGNTYRNCVFIGCVLIYSGGKVGGSFTTTDCTWELRGPALRTLHFIRDYNIPTR